MEIKSIDVLGYDMCLHHAAEFIRAGKVVSFPTETFYALGVRFDNEKSLKRVADLKERPPSKAFSIIIGDIAELSLLVQRMDPLAHRILDRLWPAALTIVFKAKEGISRYITDERGTVAVRMPAPSFALDLARMIRIPITATSANISGKEPAKSAKDVISFIPHGIDLLIDGGVCGADYPSTIIEIAGDEIKFLREGAVKKSEIYAAMT